METIVIRNTKMRYTQQESTGRTNALEMLKTILKAETSAEIRFDKATLSAYASEASNYREVPLGVIIPKTEQDFEETVRACVRLNLPILVRGAGTSMCGQAVNQAVCIDHSKYLNRILSIDATKRIATVEPGVICDQLKSEAAKVGLTFGPDPATHSRCTLGGMIGNNSCGAHSVMAGKTVENTERLEVMTTTGERFWVGPTDESVYQAHLEAGGERARIVRELKSLVDRYETEIRVGFPKLKRRVSGYNLDQLLPENGFNIAKALVGTEGTCVSVLKAEMNLVKNRPEKVLLVVGYKTIFDAADSVPDILPLGPIAMEGLDEGIVGGLRDLGIKLDDIAELPAGAAWLMVEFGADTHEEATGQAMAAVQVIQNLPMVNSYRLVETKSLMQRLWTIRETGASATSLSQDSNTPDPIVGWEDAAVEPKHLGKYLREFSALVERYGYKTNLYGHFGDGCIHSRITFDLRSPKGISDWRNFLEEGARLVVKYEGSLSGEHGDGQAKGEFLPIMYSPALMNAFREFKQIWDPNQLLNPGKLIDAKPVDENLRMGPSYTRIPVNTMFKFPDHNGGFARETERCIGMGKCRSLEGGTMCPSFKATREEIYSTRGRARLFFEMLKGEVITEGWKDEALKESLDLCLSCKGCKVDCPTHVDIPRYRSEFLYRYHQHHARTLMESAVSRIGDWLPIATRFSRVINPLMRNKVFRKLSGTFGLSPVAKFPAIAKRSFRDSAAFKQVAESRPSVQDKQILIWTDTFNNGFTPEILETALRVVKNQGWTPIFMQKHICCGRPLYDSGLLDKAKANLEQIIQQLSPIIEHDIPVLVLEPSCLSVFRDEMLSLLPDDLQAKRLAKLTINVAEFAKLVDIDLGGNAVYSHVHCHQKACGGSQHEKDIGLNVLDTGCCGMAGSFGYQTKTLEISRQIAAQELVPKINAMPSDAVLVSDGFSCRCQIRNTTDKPVSHLIELLDK